MRRRLLWNKVFSLILAGAMAIGTIHPVWAQEPLGQESQQSALAGNQVLELGFNGSLEDTSGNGVQAVSYGSNHAQKEASYAEGVDGQALSLDGGTYLDLGTSADLQPEELTVSFWLKATKAISGEHIIMWNKPSGAWDREGWYLSCLNDNRPLVLSVGSASTHLKEFEVAANRAEFFPVGEWVHVAITYSSETEEAVFYRNGQVVTTTSIGKDQGSGKLTPVGNDTDHKYLGFNSPGYNGGFANLDLDEYEIYSTAATAEQVKALYEEHATVMTDEEIVEADVASLDPFAGKDVTAIKTSVTLPLKGKYGSGISWKSSVPEVVSETGKVKRPEDEDKDVVLTATVSCGSVSTTKDFKITVLKKDTQQVEVPENPYTAYTEEQFGLDEVLVTDAYYKGAQDVDIAFLKKFDNDRLIAGFRENAGIKTNAVRYNGWENGLLAGHSAGHYLSAAAQAIQATGDEELGAKLEEIISGLKECQEAAGNYGGSKEGFLFGANVQDTSNVEKQFDIVQGDAQGNTWVPWYNTHKLLQGLVDTFKYTGNAEALEVASNLGDWAYNRVSKWTVDQQRRACGVEYGGMNDCLYELYKYTHKEEHKEAAHKFDEPDLYKAILSGNEDTLKGRHSNTTIPKFVGALNRYVALKEVENVEESDYLGYAEGFWTLVVEKHAFITGGTSDMEHFRADNALDDIRTQCNCESCCAHNMLKLSKELYKVTGDKKYADYYERTLRNAIMGAVNEEGAFSYFTPMATGYYKMFGTADPATNMFWCCTGTGMENYTKLGDSIYFKTDSSITVNQYIASEVVWEEKNMKLTQDSDVTASDKAEFTISLLNGATSAEAAIRLRIPDWAAGSLTVKINGEAANVTAEGSYLVLNRAWKAGDKIEVAYPMEIVAYGLPDNDFVYAFQYGPTVLAAKLGTEEWNDAVGAGVNLTAPAYKVVGNEKVRLEVAYGKTIKQVLGTETLAIKGTESTKEFMKNINSHMVKTEGKLEFHIRGTDAEEVFGGEGLTFVPFNTLNAERYGIYWYFESIEDSSESKILAEKEEGRFAEAVVDSIQPGYGQYENDAVHQMEESNTEFETGVSGLGSTRRAKAGGYFSYNMKVDKSTSNSLLCQFAKADVGKTVKITVGNTVFNYTVENDTGEEAFFKKYFEIPDEEIEKAQTLTVGSERYNVVRVKFESGSATEASARIVNGLFLTRAYSKDARLVDVSPSAGRLKVLNDGYAIRVPLSVERLSVSFTLADKSGLLYIDGVLVNDAKVQRFPLGEGTETKKLKVYAQDHTTYKEYTLKLIHDDGLEAGEEIIVNGDINGDANWKAYGDATLSLGYSTIHSAPNSLKINRTGKESGAYQDITGKVKAGATYEIDAYLTFKNGAGHNENPPANADFNVSILYGEGNAQKKEVIFSKNAKLNDWANLYGEYTVPANADLSKVSILFEAATGKAPAEDGLFAYFIDDISMKMIESQGNEDDEMAKAVSDKIAAIGTVSYTLECKEKIDAARAAYDALTQEQKKLVENYNKLTEAEKAYEDLKKAEEQDKADKAAAQAAENKIAAIGTVSYTSESKGKIDAARIAYNALTEAQKKLVENYSVLMAAEARYEELRKGATSKIDIAKAAVKKIPTQTYTGKKCQPSLTLTYGGKVLKKGTDYAASYSNNVKIGTATVKITGIGSYTGSVSRSFAITVKKNKEYKVGDYKYKITNANIKGKGTVALAGVKDKNVKGKLKKANVPSTVKIGGKSFKVTEIGNKAFSGCKKVERVVVGSNVTKIGSKAFYNCRKLKQITIKSKKLNYVGKNACKNIHAKAVIKVPKSKLKAYKKLLKGKGQKKTVQIKK
ncbi:beta-L-arabinofuranosidase domain-containing protein [Lachnospiraceae bacterium 29-84]